MSKEKLVWRTEKRRVNSLLPYDKNPRKITDKQMEDLKVSLTKFNLAELPAINLDGKICAGHQRIKALQLLGRGEELIEVRSPNRKLTPREFKQYLLTSNRSGGSWDFDILASDFDIDTLLISGFDSNDLTNIFDDSLEVSDDNFDEEKEIKKAKNTDIKTGDYFALGRHRLLCGNSTDQATVKKLMDGKQADMVNDDPPFNINLSYDKGVGNKAKYGGTTDDNKSETEYRNFLKTLIQNALSVSKKDSHVMFWCDERYVLDPFHCTPSLLAELYAANTFRANCIGGIFNTEWILVWLYCQMV